LYRALLLSLATSVVGYAALGLAGVAALEKVAVFSCVGLLMAWLTVVCIGPILIRRESTQATLLVTGSRWLQSLSRVFSLKVSFIFVLAATLLGGWLLAQQASFSDDPRIFFNAPEKLLQSERRVAAQASDFEPGRYIIISGESSAEVYARHEGLMRALESQGLFEQADFSSLPGWLPSQQQQAEDYTRQFKLYGAGGATALLADRLGAQSLAENVQHEYQQSADKTLTAAQLANLLEGVLPPFWFENADGSALSFVLIRKGLNADAINEVTRAITGVEYVNSLQRTSEALRTQRTSAERYLLIAVLLIACLLMVRYRRWRALGLLSVPVTALFGLWFALCSQYRSIYFTSWPCFWC
jgi:predicted exporter